MISFLLLFNLTFASPALIEALNREQVDKVEALAKDKSNLAFKDSEGLDALFHAVSLNELAAVKTLLKAGASTNEKYQSKMETVLFEATRLGSKDMVETLLKSNPTLLKTKNLDEETVLFEAVRADQSELVKFYVTKGLSLRESNKLKKKPADYLSPQNKKMAKVLKILSK